MDKARSFCIILYFIYVCFYLCIMCLHMHMPTPTSDSSTNIYMRIYTLSTTNTPHHKQVLNEEYARVVEATLLTDARQARAQRISAHVQALVEGEGMGEQEAQAEAYRVVEEEEGPVAVRGRDPVLDDGRRIQVCCVDDILYIHIGYSAHTHTHTHNKSRQLTPPNQQR